MLHYDGGTGSADPAGLTLGGVETRAPSPASLDREDSTGMTALPHAEHGF